MLELLLTSRVSGELSEPTLNLDFCHSDAASTLNLISITPRNQRQIRESARFPAAAASQQKICLCMSVFPGRRRKSSGFEDSNANRSFPSPCRLCRSLRFKWLADGIIKKCLVRSPSAALLSCKERQSFPTSQSEGAARRVFCENDRFKVICEIKVQNSAFFFEQ